MERTHKNCTQASEEYYGEYNLVTGANIAGVLKAADAMMLHGVV